MEILNLVLALTGLIIACVGSVLAVLAYIEVKGIKNSTHSIQYVPLSGQEKSSDEDLSKEFKKTGVMYEPFDEVPDDEVIL